MRIHTIRANQLTADQIELWSALQRADEALDSPQFRPEFTLAVAAVRDDVEVAVLHEEEQAVGFFPFQRTGRNVGWPVAGSLSDMQGLIVRKGVNWDVPRLLRGAGLAVWHFDHLIASQSPFRPWHAFVEGSPFVDLRNGYESFRNERREAGSTSIVQAERKARKIARELGPLRFELQSDRPEVLSALLDWKRARLKRSHFADPFQTRWVLDLLERIRTTCHEGFAGVLSALYAGDRLIAAHFGMRSGGVLSSWIPAYDPSLGRYSPGLVLHVELAQRAAEAGIQRIDLGRGHNQLKASLSSAAIPVAGGSVELRPLKRILNAGWYRTRSFVHATPLRGGPLRFCRRLRNWVMKP